MITADPAILVYAFRYALGRLTYAASDVRHAVEANLDRMPERDRALVADEIRIALREGRLSAAEGDEWAALAERLEATLPPALVRSGR
ncbi:hypothetical protein LQK89_02500 [Curtobacterium sp. C1]|uniref:hypothetical protein n=1 Tax=Curtobacterium sp. C1 TaxID=2898151 RepID=UPI001E5EB012|nr:hypothetical protein [Curtobacterium sp. C1]UFU14588.1 hypothetical protein LQK89_02500 [Curtobacterium sp. C1]